MYFQTLCNLPFEHYFFLSGKVSLVSPVYHAFYFSKIKKKKSIFFPDNRINYKWRKAYIYIYILIM